MKGDTATTTITNSKVSPSLIWQTVLYDCDCHEFWEVVDQIMLAINCAEATASQYANAAQDFGSVAVYKGEREQCERVADVLESIGLNVKVMQ